VVGIRINTIYTLVFVGVDTIGSTAHWGVAYNKNGYPSTHGTYTLPNAKTFADDFHIFGELGYACIIAA
jgi:hypothetical protein